MGALLPDRFATLVNLAGFAAALVLYAMLLVMVVRRPHAAMVSPLGRLPHPPLGSDAWRREPLLVATALLGLVWNFIALGLYGLEGFGVQVPPLFAALAFTALGLLPAVVVHGVLRAALVERHDRTAGAVVAAGYCLSAGAGGLHVNAAIRDAPLPSPVALWLLVVGFAALIVVLAAQVHRQGIARRALSLAALAVFAVSALHLTGHEAYRDSWALEIVGHHASLPLALAILYQDYPFALADLFLKRALVLVLGFALTLAAYAGTLAWLTPAAPDPVTIVGFIGLGIGMAVAYPWLRRVAHWFVDAIVLQRADYAALRADIAQVVSGTGSSEEALREACVRLAPALAARQWSCWRLGDAGPVAMTGCCTHGAPGMPEPLADAYSAWLASNHAEGVQADAKKTGAVAIVPTAEAPRFAFSMGDLAGGRRLLSDDLAMLEAAMQATARRIDQIRLTHERCAQQAREAEVRQLATEAQLRALRAQINPHFLFNALTTVGYLIQTSPDRAVEKLVQLTDLLRRMFRSEGEFTTLGKELELVRLYLDLEHARFEERLRVEIDIPPDLRDLTVPALILQPLVENAIKHGIAPSATGGSLAVRARVEAPEPSAPGTLLLTVRDSGRGPVRGFHPASGIGLRNVEERLRHYYGDAAWLRFEATDAGTVVTLGIPVRAAERQPELKAQAL